MPCHRHSRCTCYRHRTRLEHGATQRCGHVGCVKEEVKGEIEEKVVMELEIKEEPISCASDSNSASFNLDNATDIVTACVPEASGSNKTPIWNSPDSPNSDDYWAHGPTSEDWTECSIRLEIPPETPISLSSEQSTVLNMVKEGRSVFFTGPAGTGKSVLLREIITVCGGTMSPLLAITAATGIAAVNISGCTLHSWAGIGLGQESAEQIVGRLLGMDKTQRRERAARIREAAMAQGGSEIIFEESYPTVVDRWRTVRTLIIDEISMIDGVLFDKLERIARMLREWKKPVQHPFGGIQLVLCGDFCQLPPVPDRVNGKKKESTFAFQASSWKTCIGRPLELKHVFRQKKQEFVDMLNEMRFGRLSAPTIQAFRALSRPVLYDDGIEPTDLFPTRREVLGANSARLDRLPGPIYTYQARDLPGSQDDDTRTPLDKMAKLLEPLVAPECIVLKKGAQVMLIKNLEKGVLVNGSVGRVVGFHHRPSYARLLTTSASGEADVVVETANVLTEAIQSADLPAKTDGSQTGTTSVVKADNVKMIKAEDLEMKIKAEDIETIIRADEGTMALKVETSETRDIKTERRQKPHLPCSDISRFLDEEQHDPPYPIVLFDNGRTLTCEPRHFNVNNSAGFVEAQRIQVPLILAWALSIHKSQGQTLQRVRVDLKHSFEKGQAYVALSRATSMETLQVLNFDPMKVQAHPLVIQWYREVSRLQQEADEDAQYWDNFL